MLLLETPAAARIYTPGMLTNPQAFYQTEKPLQSHFKLENKAIGPNLIFILGKPQLHFEG
jgi:hypothetical protein